VEVENAYFLLRLPTKLEFTKDDVETSGADLMKTSYMHIGNVYYKLDTKHVCSAKPPPTPRPPRPAPQPSTLTTAAPQQPLDAPSVETSLSLLIAALAGVQLAETNETQFAHAKRIDNKGVREPQGRDFVTHVETGTWHRTIMIPYVKRDPREWMASLRGNAPQPVLERPPGALFPPLEQIPAYFIAYGRHIVRCNALRTECDSHPPNQPLSAIAVENLAAKAFVSANMASLFTTGDGLPLTRGQLHPQYASKLPAYLLTGETYPLTSTTTHSRASEFVYELVDAVQSTAMCITAATDLAHTKVVRVVPRAYSEAVYECDQIRAEYPQLTRIVDLVAFCTHMCRVVLQGAAAGGLVESPLTTWAIQNEPPLLSIEKNKPTMYDKATGMRPLPYKYGLWGNDEKAKHTRDGAFLQSIVEIAAGYTPGWPTMEWAAIGQLGRPVAPSWWTSPHTPTRKELSKLIQLATDALERAFDVPMGANRRFAEASRSRVAIHGASAPLRHSLQAQALARVWDDCKLRVRTSATASDAFRAYVKQTCSTGEVECYLRRAPPLASLLVKLVSAGSECQYVFALLGALCSQVDRPIDDGDEMDALTAFDTAMVNPTLKEVTRRVLANGDKSRLTMRGVDSDQPRWDNAPNTSAAFATLLSYAARIYDRVHKRDPLSHLLPVSNAVVSMTGNATIANRLALLRKAATALVVDAAVPSDAEAVKPRGKWAVEHLLRLVLARDARIERRTGANGHITHFVVPACVLATI
jgi:hypothetical protein